MGDIAWISLYGFNQKFEIIGETLVESRLGPVYTKVPISRTLIEARVLLEDCACDTGLAVLEVVKIRICRADLLQDLAKEQPGRS